MNDPRRAEWLETDGLGGYASGTVSGVRTRRYHGLLVTATAPPVGRVVLVAGLDASIETPGGQFSLSTQRYAPDVTGGEGERFIESFSNDPWPTWIFRLPDGTRIAHEVLMRAGAPQTFLSWRLLSPSRGPTPDRESAWARLTVRPFLAGRDFHALMHETPAFSFDPEIQGGHFRFRPTPGGPNVVISSSGAYQHQPHWYRNFQYDEERARGFDFTEDLGAPGVWSFELRDDEAAMVLSAERGARDPAIVPASMALEAARRVEWTRRAALGGPLDRAAEQYLVARGAGRTIIAGYPWFGDWGRDTFVSLRGLCLARGHVDQALEILSAWSGLISEGMLPNYFPDGTGQPTYNAVDASLWFVIDVAETLQAAGDADAATRRRLIDAAEAILDGYARGTRYGIVATADGLLAAGVPGQQLTWMDARVDGREITPRIGKPVEVQALWLNALALAARWGTSQEARWRALFGQGQASFVERFWDPVRGRLFDVVDAGHQVGLDDATFRPNQILAVGGLPLPLLGGARARAVVDAVQAALVTPLGLRSLSPDEPGYAPHYGGGVAARDGAYHQGTVWPWLMGPFVEAFVRVRGETAEARAEARARFLAPLEAHLGDVGLGHVSEVADGAPPFAAGGCPFQAWSLGELLRLDRVVLVADAATRRPAPDARTPSSATATDSRAS